VDAGYRRDDAQEFCGGPVDGHVTYGERAEPSMFSAANGMLAVYVMQGKCMVMEDSVTGGMRVRWGFCGFAADENEGRRLAGGAQGG